MMKSYKSGHHQLRNLQQQDPDTHHRLHQYGHSPSCSDQSILRLRMHRSILYKGGDCSGRTRRSDGSFQRQGTHPR